MHELSLIGAMVDQIAEISRREEFKRVLKLRLAIGSMSGVDPQCIEFCFQEATQGSVLEGAELTIEPVAVELSCKNCGRTSQPEGLEERERRDRAYPFLTSCPLCESTQVVVVRGKEFRVLDLEVED